MLVIGLSLSGCGSTGPAPIFESYGPAPPGYYRVRRGDTLYQIATRHNVSYEKLAQWNKLGHPYRIYAGSLLRVRAPQVGVLSPPVGNAQSPATPPRPETQVAARAPQAIEKPTAARKTQSRSALSWRWPMKGEVIQKFRAGDRTRQGIRIAGRPGQKVLAAEGGTVVYSGSGLKGYGDLIIVKHNDSYLSAYGFNSRLLVSEGATVERGQSVAVVGQASGGRYGLHFEIRRNGTAVDPLKYLP